MDKYFEINKGGHNIRCKIYADDLKSTEKVILFIHGFAGHKDNGTAQKLADRILSKNKNTAVLIFNLPSHGDDVKKKIVLSDCLEYIEIVLQYIKENLHTDFIFGCATSFGGYLTLKYISLHGSTFKRIVLRCPAVNMYEVLSKTIMSDDELHRIQKGKTVSVGFDRKIEVGAPFLADLQSADILTEDLSRFADDILVLHGTADEVVPFEVSKAFAQKNGFGFIAVDGADHRFQSPGWIDFTTKEIIRHYGLL